MESIYAYWGKAADIKRGGTGSSYHLLPYHCLDVAACGKELLSDRYPWSLSLAKSLGITLEQLQRLFIFFLCLHDLGKFARSFQGLATGFSPPLVEAVSGLVYSQRHDSLGFWLFTDPDSGVQACLAEFFAVKPQQIRTNSQLRIWFEITTGHHGQPPLAKLGTQLLTEHFHPDDLRAVHSFVREMLATWLHPQDIHLLQDKSLTQRLKASSWQLAGLTVLADWLGSNQDHFSYHSDTLPLAEYWARYALPRARQAVTRAALDPARPSPFNHWQQLFPFIEQLTPLQRYAVEQPLRDEPQLFILEDVTGSGKTEAAMLLVHRLMSQGMADGLYVGLPTMATANAMYQRMAECYQNLYLPGQAVSLVLAHGARHLSDDFLQSIADQPGDLSYCRDESSASAYCNSWIADSRKKALLADIGVGTIDQALLGILPSRHQSLRLLGLGRKVLLVDEVHAYDPYMHTLLACLLEAHALQGGSAILLSATLPQQMKQQLLAAYAKGRGLSMPRVQQTSYPLATQFPSDIEMAEIHVPTRTEVKRQVHVHRLADEESVCALILSAVSQGRCVCWIRNTVDEARQSYEMLTGLLSETNAGSVHLFHSRFAMVDRQYIEKNVLTWFGKKSDHKQRQGRVLISTQVVEQSLDIDLDILVTDLAPVDLLLQRAGRLQRHVRDAKGNPAVLGLRDQRAAPTLYILSPEPVEQADAHWLDDHRGTQAVYQDMGVLWRSAKVMFARCSYSMPDDARYLIESVYAVDTELLTPPGIEEVSWAADGKRRADSSMATFNKLLLDAGYSRKSSETGWSDETNIPTRLSDKTLSVVLVRRDDAGNWQPYADHPRFGWELSSLKLREGLWRKVERAISPALKAQMEQLRERVPALRWFELLPLVDEMVESYCPERGWGLRD